MQKHAHVHWVHAEQPRGLQVQLWNWKLRTLLLGIERLCTDQCRRNTQLVRTGVMSLTRRADVIVWCETQPSQKLKKRTEGSNCRNRMSALIGKRHFTHPQTRVPDVPRSSNARDLCLFVFISSTIRPGGRRQSVGRIVVGAIFPYGKIKLQPLPTKSWNCDAVGKDCGGRRHLATISGRCT
jgi:hypothetical protein